MLNTHVGWGIIFQKDGLDEDGMRDYLNSDPRTRVVDVVSDSLTISDLRTGQDEDIECVIFLMDTEGILVPPKFRFELNLRPCEDNPYIFQPIER